MNWFKSQVFIAVIFISQISLIAGQIDDLNKKIDDIPYESEIPSISEFEKDKKFRNINLDSISKMEIDLKALLTEVNQINSKDLSESEVIDLEIVKLKINDRISNLKYKTYLIPFNAEGGFYNEGIYTLRNREIKSIADADLMLKWIDDYMSYISGFKETLKLGIKEGIIAPKIIVENTANLINPFLNKSINEHPLFSGFENLPVSLDDKEIKLISAKALDLLNSKVIPTYTDLKEFLLDEYMLSAYEKPGISEIPNGKEYYENRVLHYATYNISPDEVHEIGIEEVKRIRTLMEKCIQESGFKGDFKDFLNFLRTDEQFFAKSPQELLNYAAWLSKKAEGQLPKLFKELPQLPFTVEPIPDAIAPFYTAGRFVHGSWENSQPGIYWVNTYDLKSRSLYNLPALTLHEAVPGHHLQTQLAAEQDNTSVLRQNYYISAFGEGWGLYSEYLGEEMGMYENTYDLFGRLTYEMWRACRLVVDTGLHSKGWTRKRALEFLRDNTALSIHEVTTEIDRYIGWPGQALSYKLGEIKIKELRKSAETQLKDDFDIKEFHYQILKNGSVPLPILEREIDKYIAKAKLDSKK